MRCRACWIGIACLVGSSAVMAGQAPDNPPLIRSNGGDPNEPNIFEQLNKSLPHKLLKKDHLELDENKHPVIPLTPDGVGVPKSQAMLCPVCKQPMWKHDLDGFVCTPLNERGEARKMISVAMQNTICPVCKAPFKGAIPENINGKGGIDRDFCVHSVGNYTVNSSVWLCPECGYAGMIDAFKPDAKPLDDTVKAFVRSTMTDAMLKRMIDVAGLNPDKTTPDLLKFGAYIDQTQIPDWIKYDNAVKIYEQMKAPRGFLATLYRDAAHACRREVYSEISVPGLSGSLQESLSKSIRRMNRYLQEQCFNVRRAEGASILDPTVMETDAAVLAQASTEIVRLAEDAYNKAVAAEARDNGTPTEKYFTTGDMYVLHIRYAGILDRLGKLDESEKALRRANSFIPEKVEGIKNSPQTPAIEETYARQLRLLHGVVEDRLSCLQKEKEYLFSAAKANMSAIMLKEVKFEETPSQNTTGAVSLDAAPASYLLGELFRRSGESGAAVAWFDASAKIVARRLALLEKEEQKYPETPMASAEVLTARKDIVARRGNLLTLQGWIQEQRALIKSPSAVDEHVTDAISHVLESCGVAADAKDTATVPVRTDVTPAKAKTDVSSKGPATAMTRDELYKRYYAAMLAYQKANNTNPPTLGDLVKGGFISAADAHLDANGKLFCPETGEKLIYFSKWEKGDGNSQVLLPMNSTTNTKTLYANGEIRERGKK